MVDRKTVAFFPALRRMTHNPYWVILAAGLEAEGIEIIRDTPNYYNRTWLKKNRKTIQILHIHFYQIFYALQNGKASLPRAMAFIFNLIYARLLGYRTIFTLHDFDPIYPLTPKWIDEIVLSCIIYFSERIIVHCNYAKEIIAQKFKRKQNIYVLDFPNNINFYPNAISKREARDRLKIINPDIFTFTFFGGIRPNKGIETLIRAFRSIKDNKLRLVIAGAVNKPANYAQYLLALAGSDRRIKFYMENIPDDEVQVYLNASDVVVLPFKDILTSGSAVLAMSFHKPIIVPQMGCLPELVGKDAGWLYTPDSVEGLAQAMKSAIAADLEPMSNAAYERVVKNTMEYFGQQTKQVYWDLYPEL